LDDRKREILDKAIEIISDQGYGSLSMRALARASGMQLGALQYHFRTWENLLRGLVEYIADEIRREFAAQNLEDGSPSVYELATFLLKDTAGVADPVLGDRLWPQLWAMEQVEPLVSELLEEIYAEYLARMEAAIEAAGGRAPRAEALAIASMFEGESLFTGTGRRWEKDREAVRAAMLEFIREKYGD
jgi:AcrR family transcriptional regulator